MHLLVGILILAILAIPFVIALSRANELFCMHVTGGKIRLIRGRLPPRLFGDLEDVLTRPKVAQAVVRVVSEQGKPRVLAKGVPEGQLQRLRNVVGTYQVAQIRSGSRRKGR